MKCPFCDNSPLEEPVCGYPEDGPRMLMCYNTDCPTTGRWLPEQIWRQIIVLQKKLDKALEFIENMEHVPNYKGIMYRGVSIDKHYSFLKEIEYIKE